MVLHALDHSLGGELYVPQIPSYRINDVAEAIGPECEKPVVGIRAGEKIHEEMVTETDALQTISTGRSFIIVPMLFGRDQAKVMSDYCAHHKATPVPEGFSYNSGKNTDWLTVPEIRQLIREHVDPAFDLT
jgi:FlaA1/EpsC-like NDP-sugar epimerase